MSQDRLSVRQGKIFGPLCLVLLPVVATYVILQHYLRALPMFDDYQALVLFAVRYVQLPSTAARIAYVFTAQHDEYKLISEHMLFALDLSVFRQIHYQWMAMLGNLFLLCLLGLYWLTFLRDESLQRRLILFAPVSFLLLQLNYVETLDWAMCGLQMLPVIFFSFLALFLLLRESNSAFWWACGSLLLAIFASGNGFLAEPVGLLILVQQRQLKRTVTWLLSSLVAAAIYFHQYAATVRALAVPHPTVLQKVRFFLSFAGSAIENLHHVPFRGASVVLGVVLLTVFIFAVAMRLDRKAPFHFYAALWLFLSAAGVAQVRIKLGLESSLTMRYKLYSDLLLVFTYVIGVVWVRSRTRLVPVRSQKVLYACALAFSMLLYASSGYFGARFLKQRMTMEETAFARYLHDPAHPSPLVDLYGHFLEEGVPAKVWIDEAIRIRVYVPPRQL